MTARVSVNFKLTCPVDFGKLVASARISVKLTCPRVFRYTCHMCTCFGKLDMSPRISANLEYMSARISVNLT